LGKVKTLTEFEEKGTLTKVILTEVKKSIRLKTRRRIENDRIWGSVRGQKNPQGIFHLEQDYLVELKRRKLTVSFP